MNKQASDKDLLDSSTDSYDFVEIKELEKSDLEELEVEGETEGESTKAQDVLGNKPYPSFSRSSEKLLPYVQEKNLVISRRTKSDADSSVTPEKDSHLSNFLPF